MQNKMKKLIVVVLMAFVALALALPACTGKDAKDAGGSDKDAAPVADAGGAEEGIVAKVGDTQVEQALVERVCAFFLYSSYGEKLDGLSEQDRQLSLNQILVSLVVPTELIRLHMQEQGQETLSADAEAAIQQQADAAFADETAAAALKEMGVERSDAVYFFEAQQLYYAYGDEIAKSQPVADEKIQAFYNENESYFIEQKQWQASHILIEDADHTPEKRADAEGILQKARDGEDFATLAADFSDDAGSASGGGDLGYFDESVNFVPEFKEAVFALKVGEISDLVETQYGYHIIKLTDLQEERTMPFEEMREELRKYLQDDQTAQAIQALREKFKVEYLIEVDPATGEPPLTYPEPDSQTSGEAQTGTDSQTSGEAQTVTDSQTSAEEPSASTETNPDGADNVG